MTVTDHDLAQHNKSCHSSSKRPEIEIAQFAPPVLLPEPTETVDPGSA
jgi:hypothetical protein